VDRLPEVVLRDMTDADVSDVLDVQVPAAVVGLVEVSDQDRYPFPRNVIGRRWIEEVATPGIHCFVLFHRDVVIGFAAMRHDEFRHFGVVVELWGTGVSQQAHDSVLDRIRAHGVRRAWLKVFTSNRRGRRFYEKLGWRPTGERSTSAFPPYAELLEQ